MGFTNPTGLLALSSVIPLIIAYLLRPKPLDFPIPSLMFISKMQTESRKFNALFNKIIKDPLFLIQLLVLILLAFAISQPFIMLNKNVTFGHTVIILDASASMGVSNRFDDAKSMANGYLSRKVSIILAENVPVKVLDKGSSSDAKKLMTKLEAKDTTVSLSDAMLLGEQILKGGTGRIVVISDFSSYEGEKPWAIKQKIEAGGIDVALVKVGKDADNIGIIGIAGGELQPYMDTYEYKTSIKNFMDFPQDVPVKVTHDGSTVTTKTYTIQARSSEFFSLQNVGEGLTTVSLQINDDLDADDIAYIYIPPLSERKILYTSTIAKAPSKIALSVVPRTKITYLLPDIVPRDFSDYDFVVIGNVSKKDALEGSLLAGTFDEYLYDYALNGGNVLVIASGGLPSYKIEKILPVYLGGVSTSRSGTDMVFQNEFAKREYFDDIALSKTLRAIPAKDSVVLVNSSDNSVLLAYKKIGAGTVVYLGMADDADWSNFHTMQDYPVFWIKLIDWLSGTSTGDIAQFNKRTGSMVQPGLEITRPDGITTTNNLLDAVGIYEVGNKKIATNLYSEKESDTTIKDMAVSSPISTPLADSGKVMTELETLLMILGVLFIFAELYVLQKRGEL